MHQTEQFLTCVYCGERISILVDPGAESQQYIEDCEVCCRPLLLCVEIAGTDITVEVQRSDD